MTEHIEKFVVETKVFLCIELLIRRQSRANQVANLNGDFIFLFFPFLLANFHCCLWFICANYIPFFSFQQLTFLIELA